MSARAPSAIYNLWYAIHRDISTSQLGGIVGDTAHSFGYHLARRDLPSTDYSVQLPKDKLGASDCASALDVTLSEDLMKICTQRLLTAAEARDPRLAPVREFAGTLDGSEVYAWDLSTGSRSYGWDPSHLWHIHLSFYREYADDTATLAPVAEVFTGTEEDPLAAYTLDQIAAAVWGQKLTDGKIDQPASAWLKQSRNLSDPDVLAAKLAKKMPGVDQALIVAAVKSVFADAGTP